MGFFAKLSQLLVLGWWCGYSSKLLYMYYLVLFWQLTILV